jgi:hypothetical protein
MARSTSWLDELELAAPNVVAVYRTYRAGEYVHMRRELRRRTPTGSATHLCAELDALGEALGQGIASLPESAFAMPGGESDWTVAEAIGHDLDARRQLTLAAALSAVGRWPADSPAAVPSVPGKPGATRAELLAAVERSRRSVASAARTVGGHEQDPCGLDHPDLGRLRCGEWLLFAGVHDLIHLCQLHEIATVANPGQSQEAGQTELTT